jgi:hypothetical protein
VDTVLVDTVLVDTVLVDTVLADIGQADIGQADIVLPGTGWLDREPERGLQRPPAGPGEQIEGFGSRGPPLKRLYGNAWDGERLEFVPFIYRGERRA